MHNFAITIDSLGTISGWGSGRGRGVRHPGIQSMVNGL